MLPISPQNKSRQNFFSKIHFPGDFIQTVAGNWFHSPSETASAGSSGHISHGISGSPRLTAAVTSHHCSGNTHSSTVAVWPNQPSVSLSFHPVSVHHQKLFAYLWQNPQDRPGGKGFSDMCIGTWSWEKPCKEKLLQGWDVHPQGSGTAQLCPCEQPQSSTFPRKTRGVRGTIPGCSDDLQTLNKQELPENCIHYLQLNGKQ